MRYAAIRPLDVSNGEGLGVALFVQGCSIRCPGCFQPQTWDFQGGEVFDITTQNRLLHYVSHPKVTRFSVLGGEPLEDCNLYELSKLLYLIKQYKPSIKIWVYTGYDTEQLRQRVKNEKEVRYLRTILEMTDVLVAGPFVLEKKDLSLKWCGSSNQQVIHMHHHCQ